MKKINKHITDLGAAAYLMMFKYKIVSKKGKSIYFEMTEKEESGFDSLVMEYLSSDFHKFDSCLMSIKKLTTEAKGLSNTNKFVTDLGIAAYLMMHDYKVIGKKDKSIYFECKNQKQEREFYSLVMDYLCSEFHRFDSALIALKKINMETEQERI